MPGGLYTINSSVLRGDLEALQDQITNINLNTYQGDVGSVTQSAGNFYATGVFGNGSNIRNLDASAIDSGTVGDAFLSSNVPLLDAANIFSATQTFFVAPVFGDVPGTQAALGLGSAALEDASAFDAAGDAAAAQAFAIQRANQTGTQLSSTISDFATAALADVTWTTLTGKPVFAAVATSGLAADVGLGNVDDTSDLNKPISTATQAALDEKAALLHAPQHELGGDDQLALDASQIVSGTLDVSVIGSSGKFRVKG